MCSLRKSSSKQPNMIPESYIPPSLVKPLYVKKSLVTPSSIGNNLKLGTPTIGGKSRLLNILLKIMMFAIRKYDITGTVEAFGGGNKFITNLTPRLEYKIFNEMDWGFASIAACTTDEQMLNQMIKRAFELQFSIQTKEAFNEAKEKRRQIETPIVEAAALTIVVQAFSRAADRQNFDKQKVENGISLSYLNKYKRMHYMMKGTQVTSMDYVDAIKPFLQSENLLLYLDPPYYGTKSYEDDFPNWRHGELAELVLHSKMKIMISNFENPYYEDILENNGWHKIFLGEIPKSSAAKADEKQEEWLWTNFTIPSYLQPKKNS